MMLIIPKRKQIQTRKQTVTKKKSNHDDVDGRHFKNDPRKKNNSALYI